MRLGFLSSGRSRAGLRLVLAGLVLVGVASVSVTGLYSARWPERALQPSRGPSSPRPTPLLPASAASMAYDPATGNMILFGGANNSGFFGDTWTWDGTTWTQQSPANSPPAALAPPWPTTRLPGTWSLRRREQLRLPQ